MEPLIWTTQSRKVKELVKYSLNPRKINDTEKRNIQASLNKFGLVEIPVVDTDNTLIAGHQRVEIMMHNGQGETDIDVRVPNRKLTEEEFRKYNILSNRQAGMFDEKILKEHYGYNDLIEWGFNASELPKTMSYDSDVLYEGKTVGSDKIGFSIRLEFQSKDQLQQFESLIFKLKTVYPGKLISQTLLEFINDTGIR